MRATITILCLTLLACGPREPDPVNLAPIAKRPWLFGLEIHRWGWMCREVVMTPEGNPLMCFAIENCTRDPTARDLMPPGC